MPIYEVTGPNGLTLELEGDEPPSESDLDSIFEQAATRRSSPAITEPPSSLRAPIPKPLSPEPITDFKPDVFQEYYLRTGQRPDPLGASEDNNSAGLRTIANSFAQDIRGYAADPIGQLKTDVGEALGIITYPGRVARAGAADVISLINETPGVGPGVEYGGNLSALIKGDQLPVDRFLGEVSKTNPKLATLGKTGQALTEMAPLGIVGALPAWASRLALAGFTADMISHAPELFEQYAEELNKPPEEQNPDTLTTLESGVIQTLVFAPLAAGGSVRVRPEVAKPQAAGAPATAKAVEAMPDQGPRVTIQETAKPLTATQQVEAAGALPKANVAEAMGGVRSQLASIKEKLAAARGLPAKAAEQSQAGANAALAQGRSAPFAGSETARVAAEAQAIRTKGDETFKPGIKFAQWQTAMQKEFGEVPLEEAWFDLWRKNTPPEKLKADYEKYQQLEEQMKNPDTMMEAWAGFEKIRNEYGSHKVPKPKETATTAEPVGPEMGADVRSDLNPLPPRGPTSIKNAVTEASRAELGLPPVEPVARRSFGRVWDSAMAAMDSDGNYQTRLIAELKQKARALTDTEDATLLHKQVELQTEFAKAGRDLEQAWEDGRLLDVEREQSRVDDLSNQLLELYDITKATGTETGRGLNARKMLANQDFTLASMVTQKRAAKGGAPLTPEETAKVTELNKKIEETQGKLDEHIGKRQEKEALDRVEQAPKELDFSEEAQVIVATKIRDKVEAGDLDISNLVQRLARMFVAAGVRERGNLVTAVHGVLKTIDPMFTERDTMDAISGYGRFKQLKKGEVEEVLRDLKQQLQMVAKIEDIEAGNPLKKSGVERQDLSTEGRQLLAKVNEAKRKYGVVDADPATTLKSALAQAKTFLTHRLTDLRQEIATRERIVKTKTPLKPDAELEALRAEYQLVRAEHDAMPEFQKHQLTQEQLAVIAERTLDRNIASLESDLSAGKLKRDPFVSRTPETQAILEKRAWLQALREHRKELWDNTPENMAEARANAIESKKNSVEKQIAELQRKLAEGDLNTPRNVRMNRPGSSPELEKLLLERDSLNTQLAEARKAARPRMTPEEKTTNALNKAIENLSERINTGDLLRKTGKPVSNPAIESLRATRTQLTDILKQLREASGMKEPKRLADALKRAEEAGAELERRINEGDIGARSKSAKPTTPEIEAARAENAELQKIVRALQREARPKKSPEEIALQTLKTRLTTANAEYQRRLNEGDFTTRKRNAVDISGDPAALRLKAENERLKNEFQRGKELDALKRRTRGQKLYAGAKETLNLPRTILSSWDLSAVLRQGGFIGLGNPVRAAKSIVPMLKSLVSERSALELEQQILSRANATLYAKSKLYLAPLDAIRLSAQEEQIMSRLAGKIPGIRASNRAFVSFLNKLRADSFDAMEAGLSKSGKTTPEELAAISNYINVATGRGNLGKAAAAAETMATVFFSPRLLASRFQLAAGEPLYGGSARTRKAVAKEYAKALIGLSTVLALGALAGGELEDDPRSADFGKIKFGNTRVDPMMGLAQITVLMSRLASGETKTGGGKIQAIRGEDKPYAGSSAADVIARFLRSKLSPVIGTGVNIVSGENVVGEPTTPASVAKSTLVPLSFQDLQDVMVEQGIPKGTALEILQFFGMGLQHHEDRKKAPPR